MNYIKRLEETNKKQERQLKEYEDDLDSILTYLSSDKFQGIENNFVNPSDIVLRINELRHRIADIDIL